jgi:hypothetical protein
MAVSKRIIRGVRDIHTYSGTVGQKVKPHEVHMKLCVLEMEKARRTKERESATRSINTIDARIQEIEVEKEELLRALGDQAERMFPHERDQNERYENPTETSEGFRIKY